MSKAVAVKALSGTSPWPALIVLSLGTFMILLDSTIVYMAVPSVMSGLKSTFDQVLWVLNGYLLTYSVLLIVAGRLGDIAGPRNLFVAGLGIFTLASALCGFAQDGNQLIAARVLQGVGGALLAPQALAYVTALFPPEKRGAAFGIISGVGGLATVAGPTLGGVIVTSIDWRWIFFLNVPVGLVTIAATLRFVPDFRPGRRHGIDPVGVVLSTAALFAITYGLIEGQKYDWGTVASPITIPEIIGAGVVLAVLFVIWDRRQSEPLIPPALFRDRNFSIMNIVGVALSFGSQGVFLPITIYLQSVLGLSALDAGLAIAPLTLVTMITAPMAGRLADRIGRKYLLIAGLIGFGAGDLWLALSATPQSSRWDLLLPIVVAGAGLGFVFAPLSTIALERVTPALAGAASGVLNTSRQFGFAIAAAVIGAVLQAQLTAALHARAVDVASALQSAARPGFIDSFSRVAKSGFQLGRGQLGAQLPTDLPADVRAQIAALAHDVFVNGYVTAMRPTMAVAVGVLLAAALATLAVQHRKPATARVAVADQPATRALVAD